MIDAWRTDTASRNGGRCTVSEKSMVRDLAMTGGDVRAFTGQDLRYRMPPHLTYANLGVCTVTFGGRYDLFHTR